MWKWVSTANIEKAFNLMSTNGWNQEIIALMLKLNKEYELISLNTL